MEEGEGDLRQYERDSAQHCSLDGGAGEGEPQQGAWKSQGQPEEINRETDESWENQLVFLETTTESPWSSPCRPEPVSPLSGEVSGLSVSHRHSRRVQQLR